MYYAAGKLCRCRAHNRLCQSVFTFSCKLCLAAKNLMDFVLFFFLFLFRNEFGFGAGGDYVSASRRWGWWRRSRGTIKFVVCSGQQRIVSIECSDHCCLSRTRRPAAADPAGEWRFSSQRVIYVYVTNAQSTKCWALAKKIIRETTESRCLFYLPLFLPLLSLRIVK